MIRNLLAAIVLGGTLSAGAYVLACDGTEAHAAATADASDSDCPHQDCDKSDCARSTVTTAANTAPADASSPDCHKNKASSTTVVLASNARTLRVEGATCGSCIVPIREELAAIKGIKDIQSGADFKDVIVTFTDGAKVSDAELIAAVKKAGYTATIKTADKPQQS